MDLSDLIAAVEAARTKKDLADLVKAELELDLDQRKTLKALRAEVLHGLGIDSADEEPSGDEGDESAEAVPADTESDAEPADDPEASKTVTVPPAEEAPKKPSPVDEGNRLLRNKDTGVTFVWTVALSKLPAMEEA